MNVNHINYIINKCKSYKLYNESQVKQKQVKQDTNKNSVTFPAGYDLIININTD